MQSKFEQHPIQLKDITVNKLSVTVSNPVVARDYEGEISLRLELGRSDFEEGDPNIAIGLRAFAEPVRTEESAVDETISSEANENLPAFSVDVELLGHFVVDHSKFEFKHLTKWANTNAPFLLLPFVREQVYGLAIRAGIKGLVFPLFIQPGSGPKAQTQGSATEKSEP